MEWTNRCAHAHDMVSMKRGTHYFNSPSVSVDILISAASGLVSHSSHS